MEIITYPGYLCLSRSMTVSVIIFEVILYFCLILQLREGNRGKVLYSPVEATIIDAIEIKGKWGIFCCLFVFYSNIIINWSQYSETVSWFMSFFHFVKDHCSKVFFIFEQTMISFCKWYHCLFKGVLHILPEILSETECNCGSRN